MGPRRLKPPSESSPAVSASGARLAHQTSQRAPKTGIFSTTSRKKIGQNPSTCPVYPPPTGRKARTWRAFRPVGGLDGVGPGFEGAYVGLLEAKVGLGWYEQRRCGAFLGPLVAAV